MTTEAIPELRDPTPQEQPARRGPTIPFQPPPAIQLPSAGSDPAAAVAPTVDPAVDKARKAANSRWAKEIDWETVDIDEGYQLIAKLRATEEKGSLVLSRRASEVIVSQGQCFACKKPIDIAAGRFAGMRTRHNYQTGRDESAYACSAACFMALTRDFVHPVVVRQKEG